MAIRSCCLCRQRLPNNFARRTNFALLSLIEKLQLEQQVERPSRQTQTDDELLQPRAVLARQPRKTPAPFFDGRSMNIQLKRGSLQVCLK